MDNKLEVRGREEVREGPGETGRAKDKLNQRHNTVQNLPFGQLYTVSNEDSN